MQEVISSLQATLGATLPTIVGAISILVLGWFIALVVRAVLRKGLKLAKVNDRINVEDSGQSIDLEAGLATGVFYVIMLAVLLTVLNVLNLEIVSTPIQGLLDQILGFVPNLIAGLVLFLVALILASLVRMLVTKALVMSNLDEKLNATKKGKGRGKKQPVSEGFGQVCHGLVILLFLPAILSSLQLTGLLGPVQDMVAKLLDMLPNILGAVILGLVGWYLARILGDITTNVLNSIGLDKFGEKIGLHEDMTLSKMTGTIVNVLVFLPALIAALDALKIEVVSGPASSMLKTIMNAIPNVFAAVFVLALSYFVAKLIGELIGNVLSSGGADALPAKIGLGKILSNDFSLSAFATKLIVFFTMLFATVAATNLLGFGIISEIVATFIEFGGQILFGGLIIAVGVWVSSVVCDAVENAKGKSSPLVGLVRFAILGLVLAMGLRAMGFANDIVNLGFGITLGAIGVAVALSFGLGGRKAAGDQMEYWFKQLRK